MDHFENIYHNDAQAYHDMITPEDVDGNLLKKINSITSISGKTLVDLGSGTGRIPLMFHKSTNHCIAIDLNYPMLEIQSTEMKKISRTWPIINGDNRKIPLRSNIADVITAGWAIGHLRDWYKDSWKKEIALILSEMERIANNNSHIIIMETLTTGGLKPQPPTPELAEYYFWLESDWGYAREVISTDFQYETVEDAVSKTEFFFGKELSQNIKKNKWSRLPEWTGIWHKSLDLS